MRSRKHTAWRKNRRFGEIFGGRQRRRFTDNIVARAHSLPQPGPGEPLPIVIVENPSRDFYFPAGPDELLARLRRQPWRHIEGLTHLWLRRRSTNRSEEDLLAAYVCGSGVAAIILYPWRRDGQMLLGPRRPTKGQLRRYARWEPELVATDEGYALQWSESALRDFYLEGLLLHELGHHCDSPSRLRNRAQARQAESFADTYSVSWRTVLDDGALGQS